MTDERHALVALLGLSNVSWAKATSDIIERSSAVDVLAAHLHDDEALLPSHDIDKLLTEAKARLAEWEANGIVVHSFLDDTYPAQLRDIREMPPVVFTRGRCVSDRRAIAVVGTRRPSDRGIAEAGNVAKSLARQGITVVSGLAAGIDTAAHRAALDEGGRTVAVIGTGLNRAYPPANAAIQNEIASHGLVLSQFWPDTPPSKQSFPMRNIVMSGYAAATVVVEAQQISGTRIQARRALEHGRTVILPRRMLSIEWANDMADRPGVIVVDGHRELCDAAEEVISSMTIDLDSLGPMSVAI